MGHWTVRPMKTAMKKQWEIGLFIFRGILIEIEEKFKTLIRYHSKIEG